ncbi:MAG TPA: hypothetical protein VJ957_09920, partial [Longimicrobiales bacterium]|nr:hypothetical protein [Longimicrobiales bacterium]
MDRPKALPPGDTGRRSRELPEGLRKREERLKRLREAQARLEARAKEAEEEQAAKLRKREAEERA